MTEMASPGGVTRVLSLIPPMTQLNTSYPSTAYITGFLRSRGVPATQDDLALKLVLRLFSVEGLAAVLDRVQAVPPKKRTPTLHAFLDQFDRYSATIGPTLRFLQGKDPTLGHRICNRSFLPEGPRFDTIEAYTIGEEGDDPIG